MLVTPAVAFRTIDLASDADVVAANHFDACVASFGNGPDFRYEGRERYLRWLAGRIEEFPDGHVLAISEDDGTCVGQLQMQVPYGLAVGYVSLFYVTPPHRGFGFGRRLQARAERYVRSWEASTIQLHVSPSNAPAGAFYRAMGYRASRVEGRMWRMVKAL